VRSHGERKVTARRGKKRDGVSTCLILLFCSLLASSRSLSLVHRLTNRSARLDFLMHAVDGAARAKGRDTNIAHARTFDAIAFTNDVVQHRWRAAAQVEEAVRRVVVACAQMRHCIRGKTTSTSTYHNLQLRRDLATKTFFAVVFGGEVCSFFFLEFKNKIKLSRMHGKDKSLSVKCLFLDCCIAEWLNAECNLFLILRL
jgi:hypothetical protein